MIYNLLTNTSDSAAVGASAAAIGGLLDSRLYYRFMTSANCWIRQGTSRLLTCVAKANLVDGETVTIANSRSTVVYEFDVTGNGVATGNVQVDVSTDTTNAQVATRLRTAILASQSYLEVTDNANGTLTVVAPDLVMTITDTVANGTFANAAATMTVSAADKSVFIPANAPDVILYGHNGPNVAIIQDGASTGTASLTQIQRP